jgi:DNA repair exonuclease SbcCD ATPase subunit
MSKLKYQYDKVEDVPESMKDSYVEKAGKWLLDVDLKQADDFKAVWQEVQALRKEKVDLTDKVSGFGDVTPDAVKTLQDRVKELEASASQVKDPTEVQKQAEEIAKLRTKPLLSDIAALKTQHEAVVKERDQYQRTLLDKELESRIRSITVGKVRERAVPDIINAAKMEGLAWSPEANDFIHGESSMGTKEWFDSKAEERDWLLDSVSGGASGGKGGKGNKGPASFLELVNGL